MLKITLGASFALVLALLLVFSFCDIPIPSSWFAQAKAAARAQGMLLGCGRASFNLLHGLRLCDLTLHDLSRRDQSRPAASADLVALTLVPMRLRLVGLRFDRLGDDYYRTATNQPASPSAEPAGPITLPWLPSFELVLERPSILGIAPRTLVCDVCPDAAGVAFRRLRLEWFESDAGVPMALAGGGLLDFGAMRLTGGIDGTALQRHIRPLLVALAQDSALPYMDAFTGVRGAVRSGVSWDVDLTTGEYTLDIPIHPNMGSYNGVPMSRTDGGVGVHVAFPKNGKLYDIRVGPLTSYDAGGRLLDGELTVHGTNDDVNLAFDAVSELPMKSLLDVMGVLNDGTLDCLQTETAPRITAKGVYSTDPHRQRDNDFGGMISFARGSLLGLSLTDVRTDYRWKGPDVSFTGLSARGRRGGRFAGSAVLSLPELDAGRARFRLDVDYDDGRIAELKSATADGLSDIYGSVDAELHVEGPLATNALSGVSGRGSVKIAEGRLAQLKLFLGMTELLAERIPGVSKLVNLSDATADFTIENGVMRFENAVIEGTLVSLSARGTYDLVRETLDFIVCVRLLKEDSTLGKYLVRPVTWAVSKYLMELSVTGTLAKPQWHYRTFLDKPVPEWRPGPARSRP